MAKKEKSPEQQLIELSNGIVISILNWGHIMEKGCNDPYWPDGANMNLVRNHVIYYKYKMSELCNKNQSLELPECYYIATPPEVDNCYMADMKSERTNKLKAWYNDDLKHTKIKYDSEQLSLI